MLSCLLYNHHWYTKYQPSTHTHHSPRSSVSLSLSRKSRRHDMGNILPLPCVCHSCCHHEVNEVEADAAAAVPGVAKKRRRKQQHRQRHVVVPVVDDTAEDGDDGGREQEEAWPECRVEAAGHGEDGAVRVRIVMKRRDIAQLVARLEAQRGAEERDAAAGTSEEVVGTELAGRNSNNGVTMMMSPCRDAWRPRLSIIPENW